MRKDPPATPRHRHRTLCQDLQIEARIGGDAGNAPPDKDPEREIVALGSFRRLHLAEPHRNGTGAATHHHGICGIRAGAAGLIDKLGGALLEDGGIDRLRHDFGLSFLSHLLCTEACIKGIIVIPAPAAK